VEDSLTHVRIAYDGKVSSAEVQRGNVWRRWSIHAPLEVALPVLRSYVMGSERG
jgi:hypothetical protein